MTDEKRMLLVEIDKEDVKRVFQNEKIANLYKKVLQIPVVEEYYKTMFKVLKHKHRHNNMILRILETEEIQVESDLIIKEQLLDLALYKMFVDGTKHRDIAVISVITEENVLGVIDDLQEILDDSMEDFCNNIMQRIAEKLK